MRTQAERRAHPRARLTGTAQFCRVHDTVDCQIVDVSAVGMAVRSAQRLETGQYLRIRFRLSEEHAWHDADVVVARVDPDKRGWTVGVEFVVIEAPAVADIVVYVEQRRALGLEVDAGPPAVEPEPTPRRGLTAEYGIVGTREHPQTTGERNTATGEHPRKRTPATRPTDPDLEIDVSAFEPGPTDVAALGPPTTRKIRAVGSSPRDHDRRAAMRRTTEKEIQSRGTRQYEAADSNEAARTTRRTQDIAAMEPRRGVSGRPIGRGPASVEAKRKDRQGPSTSTVSGGRIDRRLLNLYLEALAGVDKSRTPDDDDD